MAALNHLVEELDCSQRPFHRPRVGRRAGRVLRGRGPVPVRERARGLLRAARRGVLQAGAGARLRRDGRAGHDGRRRRALRRQGSPCTSRRSWTRILSDAALAGRDRRGADSRRSDGCRPRTSPARCSGSSIGFSHRRARRRREWLRFLAAVRRRGGAGGAAAGSAGFSYKAPAVIINQWVPAAHHGDAIGDSARRMRDLLRRMGHDPSSTR